MTSLETFKIFDTSIRHRTLLRLEGWSVVGVAKEIQGWDVVVGGVGVRGAKGTMGFEG